MTDVEILVEAIRDGLLSRGAYRVRLYAQQRDSVEGDFVEVLVIVKQSHPPCFIRVGDGRAFVYFSRPIHTVDLGHPHFFDEIWAALLEGKCQGEIGVEA